MAEKRFAAAALTAFATSLVERAGVRHDMAADVADVLVTGDLLGHTTHGLALLAPYLGEIERGTMTRTGEPDIVSARPAAQTWDGRRLPGPWLTLRALDAAAKMAAANGTGTVVIRRSHHIACLAVYLLRATERGLVAIVESSDPIVAAVVPHGGITPVLTPNPIAAGLPTSGDPILIDTSSSITSMGFAKQEMQAGRKLPGAVAHRPCRRTRPTIPARFSPSPRARCCRWADSMRATRDSALGLLVEAMTAGLSGHGRADPPEGWGGTVFVQVLDPEAFGGLAAFKRQMDHVVAACHDAKPRAGGVARALPGEAGMKRLREQRERGHRAVSDDHARAGAVGGEARCRPGADADHRLGLRPRHDARNAGQIARADDLREARGHEQRAHRVGLVVAVLDDERAAGRQAGARAGDDARDRPEAVAAGRERPTRLEADVAFAQMRIAPRRRTAGCSR